MRFLVLSFLLGSTTGSPVDLPRALLQTGNNRENVLETGAFVGWYDPRILGGRFLDVRQGVLFAILYCTD
jgi:hypothetical protein